MSWTTTIQSRRDLQYSTDYILDITQWLHTCLEYLQIYICTCLSVCLSISIVIQIPQLTTPCQDISTINAVPYIHYQYTYWDITKTLLQECATCEIFRNPNCWTEKIKSYSREQTILFPMSKAMPWLTHRYLPFTTKAQVPHHSSPYGTVMDKVATG